jgi:D-alanyl-D-alanine carboxypeptidase
VAPETTIASVDWSAFDARVARLLDEGATAVGATVLDAGEIVHEVALGRRTLTSDDPVEVGDRFRIASISKVITAITALRLVEEGRLDLDEPVGERLAAAVGQSEPSPDVVQITPRNLLQHRSGWGQYENLMFARRVESCPEAGAIALNDGVGREPGTVFRYSNVNFCLLGVLIEDVAGRPYEEVVNELVLAPLGITGMRLAGTFDVRDGDVEHASTPGRNYMEVLGGAGSWIASPTDVATIMDSLDLSTPGWKPLGPATIDQMLTVPEEPPVPTVAGSTVPESTIALPLVDAADGYGLGVMVFGEDSFGHTGTLESTRAFTLRQADGITWAITVSGSGFGSRTVLAIAMLEALTSVGLG